jgi:hypothetical protein
MPAPSAWRRSTIGLRSDCKVSAWSLPSSPDPVD